MLYEIPFRGNLRHASNLSSLLNGPMLETYPDFTRDVMACCVRVLALCDNSDLCFVGRSPENLFDFLSGLLIDSSWSQRVQLLQFSSCWEDRISPYARAALHHYLEISRLDPWHLAHRAHPVAFVDLVNSGETMGSLVCFLYVGTMDTGENWEAVKRNIRIVGLTSRTQTGAATWRWQQQPENDWWTRDLQRQAIKNVSISKQMWYYLGEEQPKVTRSYGHHRWGTREAALPHYDDQHLQALRLAVGLFNLGRDKQWRRQFARLLSQERAMMYPWFRRLVLELKGLRVN